LLQADDGDEQDQQQLRGEAREQGDLPRRVVLAMRLEEGGLISPLSARMAKPRFCGITLFYKNEFHRLAPVDRHGCPCRH